MKLLIDLGNSRMKWALERGGALDGPFGLARASEAAESTFDQAWQNLTPDGAVLCSVAGADATAMLQAWFQRRWGWSAIEIAPQPRAGAVRNGYRDPAALGADRWANLLGARALLGAVDAVIVDAGTAVTVDALRADGQHLGGAIFAGLAAARAGLAQAAPALAEPCRLGGGGEPPAIDTVTAVAAGTRMAAAGAIEQVARAVGAGLVRPAYLLTGGDGEPMLELLSEGWRHEPLLTMHGLLAGEAATCAG